MNECAICGGTVKFVKAVIKRDEIIETLQNVGPLLVPV
jgi:hypothetical protein